MNGMDLMMKRGEADVRTWIIPKYVLYLSKPNAIDRPKLLLGLTSDCSAQSAHVCFSRVHCFICIVVYDWPACKSATMLAGIQYGLDREGTTIFSAMPYSSAGLHIHAVTKDTIYQYLCLSS
jgi:hypothetical protein